MFCHNCRKPIKTAGMPYCGCRFYTNSRALSYVLIKTVNQKILIKQPLWVITQSGTVGLINNNIEILIQRELSSITVTFNGIRLGRAEYVSLPLFVEKLSSRQVRPHQVRSERKVVTVIARTTEASKILSSPGAKLRGVENGKAVISIPIS